MYVVHRFLFDKRHWVRKQKFSCQIFLNKIIKIFQSSCFGPQLSFLLSSRLSMLSITTATRVVKCQLSLSLRFQILRSGKQSRLEENHKSFIWVLALHHILVQFLKKLNLVPDINWKIKQVIHLKNWHLSHWHACMLQHYYLVIQAREASWWSQNWAQNLSEWIHQVADFWNKTQTSSHSSRRQTKILPSL